MAEQLLVEVEGGQPLQIPVRASLPEPLLSLPSTLDVGSVLLGTRKMMQVAVLNKGGAADLALLCNQLVGVFLQLVSSARG